MGRVVKHLSGSFVYVCGFGGFLLLIYDTNFGVEFRRVFCNCRVIDWSRNTESTVVSVRRTVNPYSNWILVTTVVNLAICAGSTIPSIK
jgi:hypothetical protein